MIPKNGDSVCTYHSDKMNKTLSDFGLSVNDIVLITNKNLGDRGTIFRVCKDHAPIKTAVFGESSPPRTPGWRGIRGHVRSCWVKPRTHTVIPINRIFGCVEIEPIWTFSTVRANKHTISYTDIKDKLQKVDVLFLAKKFAEFQIFITDEVKRLSGEDDK